VSAPGPADALAPSALLAQRRDRYLRNPRLVPGDESAALLVAIAWEGDTESLRAWSLSEDAQPRDEREVARAPRIVALTPGDAPRPSDDPRDEERAVSGAYAAHITRMNGVSRVLVVREGAEPVCVWEARGTASAPALAVAVHPLHGEGVWIAFHHDVREDTGAVDVAKWIALRFLVAHGRIFESAAPMADRDRDREGEEQGFEFPTLVALPDGGVLLYGRGSHAYWRQTLGAEGWSARTPLAVGSWGCRGRRVAALRLASGAILTARREREGIALTRDVDAERGVVGLGAPALVPCAAQVAQPPRVDVSPRPDHTRGVLDPAARDGRVTLFGDIHQHSAHSDGCGTADEPFVRARHVYGDDFCALSDHESFLGKRVGPGEWAYLQSIAAAHDAPGEFATLFAYEWTGRAHPGPGHKVVYLSEAGADVVSRDDVPEGAALVAKVRAQGGFAVPHHVGWTGANEDAHDEHAQPVWEICSCHGCYEHAAHVLGQRGELRDQMIDAVLARGHRFGFIASSDGHGLLWHHGVARKRDPFRTGLAAVQATSRTRAAILEALRARRCYATSGAKILLDVRATTDTVTDAPMGTALAAVRATIRVTAHGTAPIRALRLVGREGMTLACVAGEGADATLEAEVHGPFAYARVEQEDGELAWSSPIFLRG
jgi:hypothetical protein